MEIAKHQAYFQEISFVAQVVGKERLKEELMHVSIEENRIVGTDGYQLRVVNLPEGHDLPLGLHKPVKTTKSAVILLPAESHIGSYVDVDMVMDAARKNLTEISINCTSEDKFVDFSRVIRAMHVESALDWTYFNNLFTFGVIAECNIDASKLGNALYFTSGNVPYKYEAVIMPVRGRA